SGSGLGRRRGRTRVTIRIRRIVVVVPARDEQRSIGRCLDALDAASAALREARPSDGPEVHVIVVLDRCLDDTAEIVAGRSTVASVVSSAGRVGEARALGVEQALAASEAEP